MKIIMVNGLPQSGKDEFLSLCGVQTCSYAYSTIDIVKEHAIKLGWDRKKDERGRKFLSDLKKVINEYDDKVLYEPIMKDIKWHLEFLANYVGEEEANKAIFFIQCREEEDIERWKERTGAKSLLIVRPGNRLEWGNKSDDNCGKFDYDYCLLNQGTLEEWKETGKNFISQLQAEKWNSRIGEI